MALAAIDDALQDVRYQADYVEAAAFDDRAAELEEVGEAELGATSRERASNLRLGATATAAAAGVFGRQSLYEDLRDPTSQARPFDFTEHLVSVRAAELASIDSPGVLDPDTWAEAADATRVRVRGLRWAALVSLIGVVLLTVAETSDRTLTRVATASTGTVVMAVTAVLTFWTVW